MWSFCYLQLSLRENPLVVRFVRDLTYNPPTLLELAGRVIKSKDIPFNAWELPNHLATYLACAHQCVNPKCQGKPKFELLSHVHMSFLIFGPSRVAEWSALQTGKRGDRSSNPGEVKTFFGGNQLDFNLRLKFKKKMESVPPYYFFAATPMSPSKC